VERAPKSLVHGLLLIDKPSGPTSHDVVDAVRKVLKQRRVGHLGTLDPIAEGLLPLALGWATRLAPILTHYDKVYEATFRLGVETDTHDRTGQVLAEYPVPSDLDEATIVEKVQAFVGEIQQVPPLISAKKYKGRPLYWWVRHGKPVPEPPPKPVRFHEIRVLHYDPPFVRLRIHCSAGAYIRALARDLGRALGTGAVVFEIRRTRWGPHDVAETIPLKDFLAGPTLAPPHFLSLEHVEPHWPRLTAHPRVVERLLHGQRVPLPPLLRFIETPEGLLKFPHLRVFTADGRLVAIARVEYPEWIHPAINFPQGTAGRSDGVTE
jgi:tRNA pseudouridine55 synthase